MQVGQVYVLQGNNPYELDPVTATPTWLGDPVNVSNAQTMWAGSSEVWLQGFDSLAVLQDGTWEVLPMGTLAALNDLIGIGPGHVFATGQNGHILEVLDGESTWHAGITDVTVAGVMAVEDQG